MGDDDGDRCKTSESKMRDASELVACILREVDAANAYVLELRDAVCRADRQRAATLRAEVNTTWKNAGVAIAKLEQLSGHPEAFARAMLAKSQVAARGTFTELWKLVMNNDGLSHITIDE